MDLKQFFHGPNAGYLLELYERYQQDPDAVDAKTRAIFDRWQPEMGRNGRSVTPPPPTNGMVLTKETIDTVTQAAPTAVSTNLNHVIATVNLAQAIREFGHLAANIDPLGMNNPPGDPALELDNYALTEANLRALPGNLVGGPIGETAANAWEAINGLRRVYSGSIGFDYDHLRVPEEREWLRDAVESGRFRPPQTPIDNEALLARLTQIETFELFLHRIFPGKTRFSIEGLDMMVPMLDEIVGGGARSGVFNVLIGMAHRGRLNVLAHILKRPYQEILTQFKDPEQNNRYEARNYRGWTGDVKYHDGALRAVDFEGDNIIDLMIKMAPNPSHLEHVNPVVIGMARAAGTHVGRAGLPRFDHHITLPILIHGDAAFPGQGVVAETLNMHRLRGYRVGGAIHIIANNQVGFTTNYWVGRSTRYASDLAKGFKIPIVHVNADDPEACIEVARLAIAYRQKFQEDFLIDLVGYRRYGHNEGDEPRFTQPRMYHVINDLPTVRAQWAETLVQRGDMDAERPSQLEQEHKEQLQAVYESLEVQAIADTLEPQRELPPEGAAKEVETAVSAADLRALNAALLHTPDSFALNSKIDRAYKRRREEFEKADDAVSVDWATAESLALGSILAEGTAVRMTGEDVERGTFSHRHALLRDEENGDVYIPLHHIPQAQAALEIRNSPLTENAAIGFEYGYNIEAPERLVIWEAQYGDFINGAQPMIDEFVVAGNAKWEQTPSLVLLLPHGYEGQGPDHSSARLERFLQLAAKTNIRIAYPTTAAQYFHLLRRQAALLTTDPLPLIVMSPKSLLRHPLTASPLSELTQGHWQPVIDDPLTQQDREAVQRLVFCSGKVVVDLRAIQEEQETQRVAVARIEQLYTLPDAEIEAVLAAYPNLAEVVWLQEEPANMGAWTFMQPELERLINGRWPLRYIGRPRRASPAEGSMAWHKRNQQAITEHAFYFEEESGE